MNRATWKIRIPIIAGYVMGFWLSAILGYMAISDTSDLLISILLMFFSVSIATLGIFSIFWIRDKRQADAITAKHDGVETETGRATDI